MVYSRREFLAKSAGAATLSALPLPLSGVPMPEQRLTTNHIVSLFEHLPGEKALKISAPAAAGKRPFRVSLNSEKMLFVASANKTFVLCEALRQADSADVIAQLEQKELVLDASIWSLGSPTFNPPNLSGTVSERTAMEAMITRSDNTATDMLLKLVGASRVRRFIASAGLQHTLIPDSTRALVAYVFGAQNYLDITWDELLQLVQSPVVRPFLNSVETLASSADDFVSYYSRALQGEFFQHEETLTEFRRILTLCDFIYLVPLPPGVSAYVKSGNADFPGFHVRSIAGGMFFSDRWVYFAFLINWNAADSNDPQTVNAFFSAINEALTAVKNSLSSA
jgi:beta-lactamase class A